MARIFTRGDSETIRACGEGAPARCAGRVARGDRRRGGAARRRGGGGNHGLVCRRRRACDAAHITASAGGRVAQLARRAQRQARRRSAQRRGRAASTAAGGSARPSATATCNAGFLCQVVRIRPRLDIRLVGSYMPLPTTLDPRTVRGRAWSFLLAAIEQPMGSLPEIGGSYRANSTCANRMTTGSR